MNPEIMTWLCDGAAWLKYAVERQLLNVPSDVRPVVHDQAVTQIINRLKDHDGGLPALKTGKISYKGHLYWDLFFLADIGLTIEQVNLHTEVEEIFGCQLPDGTFVTGASYKPSYFCIPTILLSSIAKMGNKDDPRLQKYIHLIFASQRLDGGWHCARSRAVRQKLQHTESCPMDTLNILLLLGQYNEYRTEDQLHGALDFLLTHWEKRTEQWRPYGFGIGTEFTRLSYPAVKYGVLRVLDVLSLFPYARQQRRFTDMLNYVQYKASAGKYTAESVMKAYTAFDFGQKKEPSRWLTFFMKRIEKRVEENT